MALARVRDKNNNNLNFLDFFIFSIRFLNKRRKWTMTTEQEEVQEETREQQCGTVSESDADLTSSRGIWFDGDTSVP